MRKRTVIRRINQSSRNVLNQRSRNHSGLGNCLLPFPFVLMSLIVFPVIANGDEVAGKRWPPSARVAYGQIDHAAFDELLEKYVDRDGMVDYRSWHAHPGDRIKLKDYLERLGKLDSSKPASQSEKLAYWINAYNALTIEGILRVYPTTSIRNHTAKLIGYNIWKDLKLHSGDEMVSLDHMEHQILRKLNEPRIHFAIVCASVGCPRLLNEAYMSAKLKRQLKINTRDFFARTQNLRVDQANKKLLLSSIISWFGTDFGTTQREQLEYLAPYFPAEAQTFVTAGGYRVEFMDYNWNLNEQPNK